MVLRLKLTNGADFLIGGLQGTGSDKDGFALLNFKGEIIGYVFTEEIISITPEVYGS